MADWLCGTCVLPGSAGHPLLRKDLCCLKLCQGFSWHCIIQLARLQPSLIQGREASLENPEICCAGKQDAGAVQDQSSAVASPSEASQELHPCTDSRNPRAFSPAK